MTAAEALNELDAGNTRFQKDELLHPNLHNERMELLREHGQNPFATILACSDSRVPVEHIFDQGAGDLFVVRVAGNVCGNVGIGTIEYAVDVLNTPLIVILGHDDCGAVTASFKGYKGTGKLAELLDLIHPAVDEAKANAGEFETELDLLNHSIERNLFHSIKTLLDTSDVVRKAVNEDRVKVIGAFFHIAEGRVEWLGELNEKK